MRPLVGIDCQKILSANGHGAGVEHYIYHLVLNLLKTRSGFCRFRLYFRPELQNSLLTAQLKKFPEAEIKFWPVDTLRRSGLWPYGKYLRQAKFLSGENLSLFHGPANVTSLFYRRPTVVTMHDLIIYEHPEWFPGGLADLFWRYQLVPKTVKFADRIIAVSQATKRQVMRHFRIPSKKITVIYEGITIDSDASASSREIDRLLPEKIGSEKFLLYVGTVEPRKNLVRLIQAFQTIAPKFPGLKLVLAGKLGWKYEPILSAARAPGLENRVIFTGYVSPEQKNRLYARALGFVYPSLAEGFGLPVLDALRYQVPVLTSNNSSLPEVAGAAAIYVDPLSTNEIVSGLEKLIIDEPQRHQLIDRGKIQATKFSWVQTAAQTLKVYQQIIAPKNKGSV